MADEGVKQEERPAQDKVEREAEDKEDPSPKKLKLQPTQPTQEVDDELKKKIAKQIEYYFSDVNLIKDKFMLEQLEKNNNSVKLSVLATFVRLAQLTKSEDVMVEALKNYESEFMELNKEEMSIRRKKPLPDKEEYRKQLALRTVHIAGFPDSIQFDDLMRFFSRYGELESLSMRRHLKTKEFKGCVHVSFKNEADAKKVLEEEKLMFKDRELKRESMEQYDKRKDDARKERIEKRKNKSKN